MSITYILERQRWKKEKTWIINENILRPSTERSHKIHFCLDSMLSRTWLINFCSYPVSVRMKTLECSALKSVLSSRSTEIFVLRQQDRNLSTWNHETSFFYFNPPNDFIVLSISTCTSFFTAEAIVAGKEQFHLLFWIRIIFTVVSLLSLSFHSLQSSAAAVLVDDNKIVWKRSKRFLWIKK